MRPAPNFTLDDLVRSRDFPAFELDLVEVEPAVVVNAMRVLLLSVQPFRDLAGRIAVLSFIRGDDLNDMVGGIPDSDHLVGLACDFKSLDMTPDAFFEACRQGDVPGATWDKLNLYTAGGTLHVAHRPLEDGAPRGRCYVDWQRVD